MARDHRKGRDGGYECCCSRQQFEEIDKVETIAPPSLGLNWLGGEAYVGGPQCCLVQLVDGFSCPCVT
jgi:hypothetical protein